MIITGTSTSAIDYNLSHHTMLALRNFVCFISGVIHNNIYRDEGVHI